jgi:L-galactose dehydrogenase
MSSVEMRYRVLGKTGLQVSVLGFGASPLGDVFGQVDLAECQLAVDTAIDSGINFFDVSPYYGATLAEERLGQTLKGKRQQIVLATKCGRYGTDRFDFSRKRILASIDESLRRLGTDYVDVFQAHDIEFVPASIIAEEAIPALQEVRRSGKARFIGITGYQLSLLASLAESEELDTVLSYCRYNLLADDLKDLLLPVVRRRNLGLINASPLHMGLLGEGTPPPWHPAPESVKSAARAIVSLCAQRRVPASRLALQYCLDLPEVATTLVGMSTRQQVLDNVAALSTERNAELLSAVQALAKPVHNMLWPSGLPENADYRRSGDSRS